MDYLFGSRVGEPWIPTCFEWNPNDVTDYATKAPSCRLFPNPATENVTVECDGQLISKIELFDLTGQLLVCHENVGTSSYIFDVNTMKSGYYFIRITTDSAIKILTLVRK